MSTILRSIPALLLVALAAAGCGSENTGAGALATARVRALTVVSTNVPREHVFSGTVEGSRRVTLSTKLMGRITSLPFDIGSRVRAGEVVLRINAGDIAAKRAQVNAGSAEAEAAYGNASRQYERMKNLFATQSASKKEMDDTETMYRMAAAKLEAVKEMEHEVTNALEYGELRSPIDGSVVARMAQEGDLAAPGMPLVVIEDVRSFVVLARVPETEIAAVAVGDPVRLQVDALDGELAGKVTQVNAAGDPASRQFSVKISVTAADGLRSGMNARVSLLKGNASVVSVPSSAIVRRGELDGLFLLGENRTAVLRWIRTGTSTGAMTEILSGLRPGETVLVSGTEALRDGQPVEVSQ